jgi:hypothetical protein
MSVSGPIGRLLRRITLRENKYETSLLGASLPKTVNLVRDRNALVLTMKAITKRPAATFRRHAAWKPFRRCSNVFGPKRTFTTGSTCCSAARHCSHSCKAQHFVGSNVGMRTKLPQELPAEHLLVDFRFELTHFPN